MSGQEAGTSGTSCTYFNRVSYSRLSEQFGGFQRLGHFPIPDKTAGLHVCLVVLLLASILYCPTDPTTNRSRFARRLGCNCVAGDGRKVSVSDLHAYSTMCVRLHVRVLDK